MQKSAAAVTKLSLMPQTASVGHFKELAKSLAKSRKQFGTQMRLHSALKGICSLRRS